MFRARQRACEVAASVARRAGHELRVDARRSCDPLIILLAGTDSREALPRRLRRLRADVDGRRADAIGLLVVRSDATAVLTRIPRDVVGTVPGVGDQRIGWALGYGGPQCLIDTIRALTDVRVHHYVEIGFVAFARITSAIGGLPRDIAAGRIDHRTGIDGTKVLKMRLGGRDVLALARSRTPAGSAPEDDVDRIETQGAVVAGMAARASVVRLALAALAIAPRLGRDVVLDDAWSTGDVQRVVAALTRRSVAIRTLPVREQDLGGSRRSPFTPRFDSSSPVFRADRQGVEDLRATACTASPHA